MKKLLVLLLIFGMAPLANAAMCSMWFGTTSSNTAQISNITVASGATFYVYLFASTDYATDQISVALSYDGYSGGARTDNKVNLNYLYDEENEEWYPDVTKGIVLTNYYTTELDLSERYLAGSAHYGLDMAYVRGTGTRASYTNRLIAAIGLVNAGVGPTGNYKICMWDDGASYALTTLIGDGTLTPPVYTRPGTQELIINVPEPMTVALLGLGGLLLRRRK